MQVDVKASEAVPTNEFINATVDGVKESAGIDLQAVLAGFAGGRAVQDPDPDA